MSAEDRSAKTILIVDDNPNWREVMSLILSAEGYRVVTATNGQEGLHYLRTSPAPNLIILDMKMPVMDGWQFQQQRMKDPALAGIPLFIVSGSVSGAELSATFGVAEYAQKPVDIEQFLNTVRRYC
jgi:two-component system chemotaxis response regulator CheY